MLPLINLEEIKKKHGIYFNDPFYDTVFELCKLCFPNSCIIIEAEYNHIVIKDRISLTLSLSWNESKVYFYPIIFSKDTEINYMLLKACRAFRLFALNEIAAYLLLKSEENNLIKKIEG